MSVLSFSLSPDATARVYELLVCLAKFDEYVAIEVKRDKLTFTTLNLSKTAYSSFALDSKAFFLDYEFPGSSGAKGGDRFTCQLLNKALQSVFKGRGSDSRGRESIIERCDVSIQDQPDRADSRLIVKMLCKHGITKTYNLTYEAVEVMHALFDRTVATQGWKIQARVLREYCEYFGPRTEQLDLVARDGKAILTSFTEKISDGKEVLKQPLETSISIHSEDFDDFHMQELMHVVISVKDFKAIVTHAETLQSSITAHFSLPTRPLQFSYQNHGVHCEFTLMTTGDHREASSTPNPTFISNRSSSRQPSIAPIAVPSRHTTDMPPPPRPVASKPPSSQSQRLSLKETMRQTPAKDVEPSQTVFFMPRDDEAWDPPNYDNGEEEEMLGWDANVPGQWLSSAASKSAPLQSYNSQEGLEPTQRLSQLHGMFD